VNWIFKTYHAVPLNNRLVVSKELIILALVGFLFWIIKQEGLALNSIGLTFNFFKKSIILTLIIMVSTLGSIVVAALISQQLGWSFGESKSYDNLSLWVVTLIVIRAGVAEEVFMRGFLIERWKSITGNTSMAVILSLVPFALLHYPGQGWAGVMVSFFAGAVLTSFYLWKRDLKANIMAHFLLDFIPNVLIPLFQ
jgi:membrane protease YdiL (CAAX protease family)